MKLPNFFKKKSKKIQQAEDAVHQLMLGMLYYRCIKKTYEYHKLLLLLDQVLEKIHDRAKRLELLDLIEEQKKLIAKSPSVKSMQDAAISETNQILNP